MAVSLAVAATLPVLQFAGIFPLVQNIPKWDQWSMMPVWNAYFRGEPVVPLLTIPYNGHYNVIPRFIFFGLGLLTDWDVRWEVVLSYVAAVGTLATLLLMLRDSGRPYLLLAWIPALHVFSLKQFENFMSGYPFGQVLSQAAATLTVFLLTRPDLRRHHVLLAGFSAAVSTFSWGAGLATWPIGWLALTLRRETNRLALWLWCAAAAGSGVAAWLGAQQLPTSDGLLSSGLEPVAFALAVLGNPLTTQLRSEPSTALALGLALLVAFALSLAGIGPRSQRLLALRWGLYGLLALGSSLMIALGRHRAGLEQSLVSHYVTAAYPLAIATIVLATGSLVRLRRPNGPLPSRLAGAACLLLLGIATVQPVLVSIRSLYTVRSWQGVVLARTERLVAGQLSDDEIRTTFHPNPTLVRRSVEIMRRNGLALFADPQRR